MSTIKILNDGPAVEPAKTPTGPVPDLLKTIERISTIKKSVKNNDTAIYYLDCAISALIKSSDYKAVQKQIILETLADLHEQGIINLGHSQKCSECGTALQPTSKATMDWKKGEGPRILCDKCSKNREAPSL